MLPYTWRRLLTMVRILLGLSGLTLQLISSSFAPTDTVILFAAYTAYACVALFWRGLEDSGYPTLALLLDLVFFVLSTTSNVANSYWVSAVFFAFVLLAAVMLLDWSEPPLLGGALVAFLYAAQTPQTGPLLPALLPSTLCAAGPGIGRAYLAGLRSTASR